MFVILFKNIKLSLIGVVPNFIAAFFILGIIGLLGIPLDMMTITIAAITIGIAVDNSIHYIYRFKEEFSISNDYNKTIDLCHSTVGKAILNTSITIVFGFSILVLSKFIPTIYFGIFTGLAMLLAMVSVLTLLPSLILLIKPFAINRGTTEAASIDQRSTPARNSKQSWQSQAVIGIRQPSTIKVMLPSQRKSLPIKCFLEPRSTTSNTWPGRGAGRIAQPCRAVSCLVTSLVPITNSQALFGATTTGPSVTVFCAVTTAPFLWRPKPMNNALPDRVVMAAIALTLVVVFALIFSLRPNNNNAEPLLWKEQSSPSESSLAIWSQTEFWMWNLDYWDPPRHLEEVCEAFTWPTPAPSAAPIA